MNEHTQKNNLLNFILYIQYFALHDSSHLRESRFQTLFRESVKSLKFRFVDLSWYHNFVYCNLKAVLPLENRKT